MSFKKNDPVVTQNKWVIISRVIFALVLSGSCYISTSGENFTPNLKSFSALYYISAVMLMFCVFCTIWFQKTQNHSFLAYTQAVTDTFFVTSIIYVTGSYESIFTFLYLVVIIYTSMLLFQKGAMIVASISCIQYAVLVELEYYKVIQPYLGQFYFSGNFDAVNVFSRILVVIAACFAVAALSGILAVQLRTAREELQITQEHLRRVERMEMMDELVSGIAHEVKNPLASLSGSIQLLQEDTKPGSYEDKLMQIILRETDRLKNIVNDIRLFSKPSTRNAAPVLLSSAIDETVSLFMNDPEYNQRIRFALKLDCQAAINIDPAHLNQILWNLLKNSAQAIEENGEIRIHLNMSKNHRVKLVIEDTGKGIQLENKEQIFDPFYTTKPDGTGLGLSIIHRLIDTYDGLIDFESIPGNGTVFTIIFNGVRTVSV